MEPDSDQSSHVRMDRCSTDVFEFGASCPFGKGLVLRYDLAQELNWGFRDAFCIPFCQVECGFGHNLALICQAPLSHTWKASVSVQVTAA